MQGPPVDLSRPDAAQSDRLSDVTGMAWLGIVTALAVLVSFLVLVNVNDAHTLHGDRAATPAYMDCTTAEFDAAIRENRPMNADVCTPDMPWYAAHPGWYALAIGAAVFVVGRGYLFMRRMEGSRGF